MVSLSDFEPWWQFGFALLIGALIGLEREFYQQKKESPDFAGIRTFSLIALLGSIAAFLSDEYGIILAALSLAGLILLVTVSYATESIRRKYQTGITTEVAAILTFLFGFLVMGDQSLIAIALAVVTSMLLAFKGKLHGFIRNMSSDDIYVTLQFLLITVVILPLLPNRPIDPFGLFNLFQIWLMVVFVSGIGFIGYVLIKILGPKQGINLMGILGGLASSTATTISFSSASREHPQMASYYARAVVLSSIVMFPRILFLILVIYPPLALKLLIPMSTMLITGLLVVFVIQKGTIEEKETVHPTNEITNPLKLSTAIKFGLLFAVVLVIVEFAQSLFGSTGVYLASMLTGLTDVNAITLSVTRLANRSQLALDAASIAILIAVLVNMISKGGIAYFSGTAELHRSVIRAFLLMFLAGIISGAILYF